MRKTDERIRKTKIRVLDDLKMHNYGLRVCDLKKLIEKEHMFLHIEKYFIYTVVSRAERGIWIWHMTTHHLEGPWETVFLALELGIARFSIHDP